MSATPLATKLYTPPPRPKVVARPHLIGQINNGLHRKLTLISAPAGFGKTTLASEWAAHSSRPVAWLSLDSGDNDPARFLTYLVTALQGISSNFGKNTLGSLQSLQTPSSQVILTTLLNEIASIPHHFALVLDDYHAIDSKPIDQAMAFLIDHLPPGMHLVIATREDPDLPLARLRARNQLTEVRVTDLRFTALEAADFLNKVMDLSLSEKQVAALEARTEGWIAGLQLAAASIQVQEDIPAFIESFTGGHHFVMDYLLEEVLGREPEHIQAFLLRTSILDRLCGPLCDAVLLDGTNAGQKTLEHLEQANLFIIPLDNERRWYRYHHLFADLLKQRLEQSPASSGISLPELHIRASEWHEANGFEIQAFQHAAAANDIPRAERLIEGKGMPLHFRGAVAPVLGWLESLPASVLNAHPALWTAFASTLLVTGQTSRVEPALQAAEMILQSAEANDTNRDLIGRVAAIRATVAAGLNQVDGIIAHSQRALEYLHLHNLAFRTSTNWKLGFAYHLRGDRAAARQAYAEVVASGRSSGNMMFTVLAMIGLGNLHEGDNQLHQAAQAYHEILKLFGENPLPFVSEAYAGLARIHYEWNELDTAQQYVHRSIQMARLVENNDRFLVYEVFLARLQLARGDVAGASATLARASQFVRQHNLVQREPEVAAAQVLTLLRQGNLEMAGKLVRSHQIPLTNVRVQLAEGDASTALAALEPLQQQMETKGWEDERLKVMILHSLALNASGDTDEAAQLLAGILAITEPHGFIRTFVDEGMPMKQLLSEVIARALTPEYAARLSAVFEAGSNEMPAQPPASTADPLVEALSERELEVLKLIAQGLSNQEISEKLFLALSTVKGHNLKIFGKLQVQRRTEAVARARELGLV
jgi:LuxR family maltose regulon positive regulatory protein